MTILVTGGTGYIGSHTCVELLKGGHEVVIADNLCNSDIRVLDSLEAITGVRPAFYLADMLDKAAFAKPFEDHAIEAVIHFAGLKAVGESVQKPLEYYRNNLTGTLNLLEIMREHGCSKISRRRNARIPTAPPNCSWSTS